MSDTDDKEFVISFPWKLDALILNIMAKQNMSHGQVIAKALTLYNLALESAQVSMFDYKGFETGVKVK